MNDPIKKSIQRGAIIQALGNIFRLGEFGLTLLAAKLFGSLIWGQYIFITTLILPIIRLSTLGLDKGLIWLIAKFRKQKFPKALFIRICVHTLTSSIILTGMFLIYNFIYGSNNESKLIDPISFMLVLCCIPILALTNLNLGVSIGKKRIEDEIVIRTIIYPIFYLALPCALYFLPLGIRTLSWCFLSGTFVGFLYSIKVYYQKNVIQFRSTHSLNRIKFLTAKLYSYSWPLGIKEFMLSAMQRVDIWSLAYFLDARSVGVYGLALAIGNSLKTIRMALDPVMLPIFAEMKRRVDDDKIKQSFIYVSQLVTMVQFPVLAALLFFSSNILQLSGSEYLEGEPALIVFGITFLFNGYFGLSAMIVMGLDKSRWALINDSLSVVLSILLNLLLVPKLGIIGAAISTSLTYIIINLIWFCEACYLTKKILLETKSLIWFISHSVLLALVFGGYNHLQMAPELTKKTLFFSLYLIVFLGLEIKLHPNHIKSIQSVFKKEK